MVCFLQLQPFSRPTKTIPGFIDVHQRAQDIDAGRVKAFDGVTTALETEIVVPDLAAYCVRLRLPN